MTVLMHMATEKICTVHPHYNRLMVTVSVTANVCYNQVKGYSQKSTIGYMVNSCNKHRNIQCHYIKVFILGFLFEIVFYLQIFLVPQHVWKFTIIYSQIMSITSRSITTRVYFTCIHQTVPSFPSLSPSEYEFWSQVMFFV